MALFDNFLDMLKGGANYALVDKGIKDVQSSGTTLRSDIGNLANTLRTDLTFKPYTVTSGAGSFSAGPEGATSTLTPELQQMMAKLQEGAGMFYDRSLADTGTRAADITAQMEAAMAPQRERERLALEQRLMGQGRLGVQTAAYGGTPEQLALAKAIEEQRSANAFTARGQAMGEQLQNYNIGQNMFGLSFMPQQQNLAAANAGVPFAELLNRTNQQRAVTTGELGVAGINAASNTEQQANALRLAQLNQLAEGLFGAQQGEVGLLSSIFGGRSPSNGGLSIEGYLDLMRRSGAKL